MHLLEDTWLVQCLLVHQIRFSGNADWSDSLGVLQDGSWELGSISRNLICTEANNALMCWWCLPNSVRTMHWLCSFQVSEIVLNSPWTLRMHALWQRTLPFICCLHAVFEGVDFPLVFSSNPQALPHHYWATTLDQRVWDVMCETEHVKEKALWERWIDIRWYKETLDCTRTAKPRGYCLDSANDLETKMLEEQRRIKQVQQRHERNRYPFSYSVCCAEFSGIAPEVAFFLCYTTKSVGLRALLYLSEVAWHSKLKRHSSLMFFVCSF